MTENFSRLTFVTILSLIYSTVSAQLQFTVDKVFFPDEQITSVSVGSGGVWVIKGKDSLGLGKVDLNDNPFDYSTQMNQINKKPLSYLLGKYRNEALLASDEKLFRFKDGVVSEMDTAAAGIFGNKILGIDGSDNSTRILTNDGLFTSYDDIGFSPLRGFSYSFPNPKKLAGTAILYNGSPRCSPGPMVLNPYFSTVSYSYTSDLPYDSSYTIYDFEYFIKESLSPQLFLAYDRALLTSLDCRQKNFFTDTAVYCLQVVENSMLIGTENGLFYCNTYYATTMTSIQLEIGKVKIYAMALEIDKGILWLGTDKGLIRLHFDNKKESDNLLIVPEWLKQLGGKDGDHCSGIATDKQGDIFITGNFKGDCQFGDTSLLAQNSEDYFIAKYNNDGSLKWIKTASAKVSPGFIVNESGLAVACDSEGNAITFGSIASSSNNLSDSALISFGSAYKSVEPYKSFINKYSKDGNLNWTRFLPNPNYGPIVLKCDEIGNIYLLSSLYFPNEFNLPEGSVIFKFDKDGNMLWSKSFPGATSMEVDNKGRIYTAGSFNYGVTFDELKLESGQDYSYYILIINTDGEIVHSKYFTGGNDNPHVGGVAGLSHDGFGNILISGSRRGDLLIDTISVKSSNSEESAFLLKMTPQLKLIWGKRYTSGGSSVSAMITDSLGFTIGYGNFGGTFKYANTTFNSLDKRGNIYYLKIDPYGNLLWAKQLNLNYYYNLNPFITDHQNNIIGFLNTENNLLYKGNKLTNLGQTDAFLYKVYDSLNTANLNIVRGNIYNDKNENRSKENAEPGLNGIIVKAEPGEFYSQTDAEGNYIFYLNKGNYNISQVIPENKGILISQENPPNYGGYNINFPGIRKDTSGFNFADKTVHASYLNVDINSIRRRRCFRGTTIIKYCNDGFVDATDAKLKIELPEYVIPISSDKPWTFLKDKTITYHLGNVPAGHCGNITITDSIQCGDESILGLTQCVKAIISPPNNVKPLPANYDHSDLSLKAGCRDNGYISFTLANTGSGNMSDSTQLRIMLDSSLVYKKKIKLSSRDSISLNIPANGRYFRAEADQTPYHPSGKPATLTLEGCKGIQQIAVSKGFTNQLPLHDEEEEIEISCMEIIGSMDPNDKQVIPSGVTENHNIEEDAELEYILRFMNKGTDTAFTVVIVDTISSFLDISTFKPGVTSHPCTWKITGQKNPVITCTFNNILLPDSITNEKESNGFAKFKIKLKENIKGEKITNKGYIFFDYNSAVITNEAFVTVGMPPLPERIEKLQNCNVVPIVKNDTLYAHLCGVDVTELPIIKNDTVYSSWNFPIGNALINISTDTTSKFSAITFGNNKFIRKNEYCNASWSNIILIDRYRIPEAGPEIQYAYCEGSKLDSVFAPGDIIQWYGDPGLTSKLSVGNRFLPAYGISKDYYYTQTSGNCEGRPTLASIIYKPRPSAPVTTSFEYCFNDLNKIAKAEGENIVWYYDSLNTRRAGTGNVFKVNLVPSGDSLVLFATEEKHGCASIPSIATIKVKPFDISEVVVPNWFSRSQDKNFYMPHYLSNECVGDFEGVNIYDMTGKRIFYSMEESFAWSPLTSAGHIFLYQIKYSNRIYRGKIFITD